MSRGLRLAYPLLLALLCAVIPLIGCDGKGLFVASTTTVPGDGDGDGDNGTGDLDDTELEQAVFAGIWVAAYADDQASGAAPLGENEYVARMVLAVSGANMTASGSFVRGFRFGTAAQDRLLFTGTGTVSDKDATLSIDSVPGGGVTGIPEGELDNPHDWFFRLAGDRLLGVYVEDNGAKALVRSGHATFHRVKDTNISGVRVGAISDSFSGSGLARFDRTAILGLTAAGISDLSSITGGGEYFRRGDTGSETLAFNVRQGFMFSLLGAFTLGELDLATQEQDWGSYASGDVLVGGYTQFNVSGFLTRLGHATFYPAATALAAEGIAADTWSAAFRETSAADGEAADFLSRVVLTSEGAGQIGGLGVILDQSATTPIYEGFTVANGTVDGTTLTMDWVPLASGGPAFEWNLEIANGVLVGTFSREDGAGFFLGRGQAEWRPTATSNLEGTWTAEYYDTNTDGEAAESQLAIVTITSQDAMTGAISGAGALRVAGETTRRLFTVSGTVSSDDIAWTWSGDDLDGDVSWRLRQAGTFISGTFANATAGGTGGTQGHALFVRTSRTDTFTP
jgi:hypothetical protein